jgi:hypothetical protein
MTINGDALDFRLSVRFSDEPTAQQQAILQRMVESIRFQPWSAGEIRNGFEALMHTVQATSDVQIVTPPDDISWAVSETNTTSPRFWAVALHSLCEGTGLGASTWSADGAAIVVTCEDGTTARWGADGQPEPGNPPGLRAALESAMGIQSWDGWLIAPVVGG